MLANPEWEKKQLLDLSKPSLQALSYVLRHRELWPEGFKWDFTLCTNCAMGLTSKLWNVYAYDPYKIGEELGISGEQAQDFFCIVNAWVKGKPSAVTPEMVAEQIDLYLANH